jgi:hypothetical protein
MRNASANTIDAFTHTPKLKKGRIIDYSGSTTDQYEKKDYLAVQIPNAKSKLSQLNELGETGFSAALETKTFLHSQSPSTKNSAPPTASNQR